MGGRNEQRLTSEERVQLWLKRPNKLRRGFVPAILVVLWLVIGLLLYYFGVLDVNDMR